MALGDPYVSLEDMKSYMKIHSNDQAHDAGLTTAIKSSSHDINSFCRRQFNRVDVASTRVFGSPSRGVDFVSVDDFYTLDDLVIKVGYVGNPATTLSSSQYHLSPRNGVMNGEPGWPFWTVNLPDRGIDYDTEELEVTAKWGWSEVPESVIQATKLLAATRHKLKDAPLGVSGLKRFSARSHHCSAPCEMLHDYVLLMENLG